MNTLQLEKELAEKFHYKKLPDDLSEKYRKIFIENIPAFLSVDGASSALYTSDGTKICDSYDRIVVGDYGAFVEFSTPPGRNYSSFIVQPGQEYRINNKRYSQNVKYIWLTARDQSHIKIYKQIKPVVYADYLPHKYYVSVHECFDKN